MFFYDPEDEFGAELELVNFGNVGMSSNSALGSI